MSADLPLMQAGSTSTATLLERDHAAFVTGLAHQARLVMSVRLLSTGVAKDVSGVLRVTRGAMATEEEGDGIRTMGDMAEMEVLYFVSGDGSVNVFERGAGG